jgi:hypothetical protein
MTLLAENQTVAVTINGYEVGDRLLEDVLFHADLTIKAGKVIASNIRVDSTCEQYFNELNTTLWLTKVKDFIESNPDIVLEDSEYELPASATPASSPKVLKPDTILKPGDKASLDKKHSVMEGLAKVFGLSPEELAHLTKS